MNAIIDGLPEAEYRAMPGLSGTEVAKILDNPADLKWRRDHPTPSTAAQSLGTLVHALVLTPDVPLNIGVNPFSYNKERKEWTARKAELEAEGLTPIPGDVLGAAVTMRNAVMAHPEARRLLEAPGHSEVTVTGEHNGAPLKGRIDRLPNVGPVIDLKSGKDVSVRGMEYAASDYGYFTQLRHYARLAGREEVAPYIIAVRNQDRPAVRVYQIDAETWDLAGHAVTEAWNRYAECVTTGEWPDTAAEGIALIGLTPWARTALERQIDGTLADAQIAEIAALIGEQA